jgi:hypothetical protein
MAKWSEQELQVLLSNYRSMRYEDLCRLLPGRNVISIKNKIKRLGLTEGYHPIQP